MTFDGEIIKIDKVDYRGWNAADWEFTYRTRSGNEKHVRNRGFVTDDTHAYSIYWSVPAGAFEDSLKEFEAVAASFQPDD